MSLPQTYVGVDIAKNWIDIFDPETNTAQQISARPKRLTEYAHTMTGTIVVFEASGGYERLLMDTLAAHNIAYVRVNPRQSREFARATGRLAKTDKVDAKVLAQMGAALRLAPTPHLDKTRAQLADMIARREDIKAMMRAENNRLSQARLACIKRDIKSVLGHLAKRLAKLEEGIAVHVQTHDDLRQDACRLQTMPGIGPILSTALIATARKLVTILNAMMKNNCDYRKPGLN